MSSMNREQDDKRDRVLKAAQDCFTLYGFKRTSMDDIAQKASISRAALYLLFPNKEAIFRSLAEELHHAAIQRAEAALQIQAPLAERLVGAFEGKDLELLELVCCSTHGVELVDMKHAIGADITAQAESIFQDLLTQTLVQAEAQGEISLERVQLGVRQCAELLILTVAGTKQHPFNVDQYRQRLAQVVRIFCTALTSPSP